MRNPANGAEGLVDELRNCAETTYVTSYQIVLVYAGLGDRERTFEWLEFAYRERSTLLSYLKKDARLDNLRSDLEYFVLLREIGLER